jgi:hypothetical protein
MKVRTGHVSNSSSSSFALAIYNKSDKNKTIYEFLKEEADTGSFEEHLSRYIDAESDLDSEIKKMGEFMSENYECYLTPGLNLISEYESDSYHLPDGFIFWEGKEKGETENFDWIVKKESV